MQQGTNQALQGKRVAILMTDGVEQVEYTGPREFLEQQGAQITLISPKASGEAIQGFNHLTPADKFKVELDVRDARPADFDALVLPGGVANPDQLRLSMEAITFIRAFGREDKPIAAICHGPSLLAEADILEGRAVTGWPSILTDLENAGAQVFDEEVIVDGNLITGREPADIPAFSRALIDALNA